MVLRKVDEWVGGMHRWEFGAGKNFRLGGMAWMGSIDIMRNEMHCIFYMSPLS